MTRFRRLCATTIALVVLPSLARAQQARGTITGQVIDDASRQPVPSAQISIVGTQLGALTNERGRFVVPNVPAGAVTVRAARIGYRPSTRPVTVAGRDTVTVDISIGATSVQLDEIVVTGTAGSQVRRAQPAVVSTLNVSELTQDAPIATVSDVLQSRIPGVSVQQSSGSSGTSQSIRIRGASSISLSNEPLIFIDGIRAESRNITAGRGNAGGCSGCDLGGQAVSRLNDLNPEEIESIEVVKGPAAATLYGADASAGVIQIITKRGKINSGSLQQTVSLEYNSIDPNYTPPSNYALCTAPFVAPTSPNPKCVNQPVGTLISDNPLLREHVLRTGLREGLAWTGRGGGSNYGYFASANFDTEDGTLPNNSVKNKGGRLNFHFQPAAKVIVDAGYGLNWTNSQLPDNGNNPYGFLGALISNPLTLGGPNNGWNGAYRDSKAIAAIQSDIDNFRNTPTIELRYTSVERFTNRLTVGGDFSRTNTLRLIPKNDLGSYFPVDNVGNVKESRYALDQVTLDYLGNIKSGFLRARHVESDLSFGAQLISQRSELVFADGLGLATNAAHAVSSAATRTSGQTLTEQKSIGYLAQWQLGFSNRLFLQLGARLDQNSGFGANVNTFFLPKAGVSYVLSEEPFWQRRVPWASTMRLRAAYGTTGRAPTAGAADQTYQACPYVVGASTSAGLCLLNPGNANLRPEKGTEFEGGLDLGFLQDRVGAELTYFDKTTTDLLLVRQVPPSQGFLNNPFANIGKVVNRGVEADLRAQILSGRNLAWEARLGMNTLHNEVISLGDLPPSTATERNTPGRQLSSFFGYRVKSIDVANRKVIVGDTMEFIGNKLPTYEGNFGSTFTFFRNIRLYGQLDWKGGYRVNNNTDSFREKTNPVSRNRVDTTFLPQSERLRRYGPFFTQSGTSINASQVNEAYIQDGSFVRLREVSATFSIPTRLVSRLGAGGASVTLAGRNLALWSKYEGPDPELHSNIVTTQFDQSDFLTLPPVRRWVAKINLQF